MYLPRRKCRKVCVWISLAAVAQVIFSLFLYEEFNFAPIIRRGWMTKRFVNGINMRLRLQSQDVDHMGEKLKFIARAKLDHTHGKEDGLDYKRNLVTKSIAFLPSGKSLQNSPHDIRQNDQDINLSVRIIEQEGAEHKSVYHGNENNVDHEFRTENREGTNSTEIEDVFISIKTTGVFHETRLKILLDTWIPNSKDQVKCTYVFQHHSFCLHILTLFN